MDERTQASLFSLPVSLEEEQYSWLILLIVISMLLQEVNPDEIGHVSFLWFLLQTNACTSLVQ
jgi:glucose-6-phosphate-specific signal transduction histidine kinase